jgi:DNA invertase Pin-like site-specific DNA recombinase
MKKVALYLRVSTDDQTTDNQRRELEAVASRHSWSVVRVFEDSGISGAKGRDARPGLDALMKGVSRRDFDMVLAWSVDLLGRYLTGLLELLTELHAKHVDLYLHQQGLDTSTPSGKAMFQMMGVFAEFERSMIRERVLAGMSRAAASGTRSGKPSAARSRRRRSQHPSRPRKGRYGQAQGRSTVGVATGTVQRIARRWARPSRLDSPGRVSIPSTAASGGRDDLIQPDSEYLRTGDARPA